MIAIITQLELIDNELYKALEQKEDDIDENYLLELIAKRDALIKELLSLFTKNSELKNIINSQQLLARTQNLTKLLEHKTKATKIALDKFKYGRQSIQKYWQFT